MRFKYSNEREGCNLFFPERIKSIKETDKVLEIGPGSSPFPRSDVLLEKKFDDKKALEQRGLQPKVEYNKAIYYYDGSKFPFQDNEFDYVICSQVLEHVPANEFANFVKEVERVAKRGYIEVPRLFYENLFNFHVHKWLINFKDGKLLLLDKRKVDFSHIQDIFYLMLKYGFQKKKITIINDFDDFFMIGYEWENRINYEIVDGLEKLVSKEDVTFYKEYFMRLDEKKTDVYCMRSMIEKIFRKIQKILRYLIMKLIGYYKLAMKHIHLIIDLKIRNFPRLTKFYGSYKKYKHLANAEELNMSDIYPCINDDTPTTPFDAHYFYQGVWALRKIKESGVESHVDVGSEIRWIGLVSAITKVTFIDLRPFKTDLEDLAIKEGNILNMPFEDSSVDSLSCLHVAEHIGLGRYGDKLDPDGTKKACKELSRILAINGNLHFSVPVGKQKTYFNAHRVHSPTTIIDYFKELELIELSGITDSGRFIENIDIDILEKSKYACGLFCFVRRAK